MMRNAVKIILAAGLLAAAPVFAQAAPINAPAGEYGLEKTHASLTFSVTHLGLSNYMMRFPAFDATIVLDPQTPTRSTVSASVDVNSMRTDFPFPEKEDFDKVIATKFLKSGEHPAITFQSTGLKATGAKTGKLTGNLTMLGVTKPVVLDVTLNGAMTHPFRKVPAIGFSAVGSFNRSDFGSTDLQGPIGDEVKLRIEAEFLKK
ncbi:MAG: YceI family protein [Sandaracinobacteroides sp.]